MVMPILSPHTALKQACRTMPPLADEASFVSASQFIQLTYS